MKRLYVFNKEKTNQLLELTEKYLRQIKKNYFSKNNVVELQESRNQLIKFIQDSQLDYWDEFDLGELEKYMCEYPQIEDALIESILDTVHLQSLLDVLNEVSEKQYDGLKRFIRYYSKQEDVIIYASYLNIS